MPLIPQQVMSLLAAGRSHSVDGKALDPMLYVMRAGQRLVGADGLVVDDDVWKSRMHARATAGSIRSNTCVAEAIQSTVEAAGRSIPVRHYRPSEPGEAPLLVYYHGGGFVIGDLDVYDAPCRLICQQAGVHVLAVDYRLAPEHPAPAAVDDAYDAYLWARAHATQLGADPNRVAVGGDSAGGNLAAVVCQRARDEANILPTLQMLIYPIVDFSTETRSRELFAESFFLTKHDIDWFGQHYVGQSGIAATDPVVSPLLAGDLSGLPPALVVTAGFDPLCDEGDRYAAALRDAGVTVDHRQLPTMTHLFVNYAPLGGGPARAMAEVNSALRAHLARG